MPRPVLAPMLFLLLAALPLRADDASKLSKAREYFALTHAEQLSAQMEDQVTGQANQALLESLVGATPTPEQERIIADMKGQIRAVLDRSIGFRVLEPEYAKLIAGLFTEDQLDQILAFYRSPAGQVLVEKSPLLLQQTSAIVQERVKGATPELQAVVRHAMEQMMRKTPPPPAPQSKQAPGTGS